MSVDKDNFLAAKGFLPSLLLVQLLVVFTGCTAGNGEGLDQNGQPIPPTPAPNTDFQEIQSTIFTPICTGCHTGAGAPQGLRLDAANSYASLVNVASNEVPSLLRVNPGSPDQSYLVQKIQGNASVGGRMPLGQAALPQDRIDLVRRWISAGAPQSGSPPNNLVVTSSIPAAGEVAVAGLGKLTVIFAGEVDAALAASNTFELRDGFDQPVAITQARVPLGRPYVVELTLERELAAGSYQLRVHGEGPVSLADTAGRVLDGDADGVPGGDYLMSFDVSAGASR